VPRSTVDRRAQGVDVERHLAAAVEYLAIAESGDAEKSAYEHAADEIIAAMEADPTLGQEAIGRRVGKSRMWVRRLVAWRTSGTSSASPFTREAREERGEASPDDSTAKKVARERPEAFAAAFEQAPPEAKRKIAQRISQAPEIRVEARKRDVEAETRRRPEAVPPRVDHTLYEFEARLVSARRNLREALALVDGIDNPGDDEDILELLGMLGQMVEATSEAYKSGKSLDTWAWELYERSAEA
jgi:hypothetical protein